MQISVLDLYTNEKQIFEGSEAEVRVELYHAFPWLLHEYGYGVDTSELVNAIDRTQQYSALISSVELTKSEILIKCDQSKDYNSLEQAAEFLSGKPTDEDKYKEALLLFDGDESKALLACHGLEPTKANVQALGAISLNLNKSEEETTNIVFNEIKPATESGIDFALSVKRASDSGNIKVIKFKTGKHSGGTLIAKDSVSHITLLLKPGKGKSPATGEDQVQATASQREAAFSAVAAAWGLGKYVPECHLLIIDGKDYAAIKFLPPDFWENGQELKERDPNSPRRVLSLYLKDIFKFAAIDYILGNPDRNSGNVMFCQGEIKLIDHGSAFAGIDFKPGRDKYSFVPFYLRALSAGDFNKLSPEQKLKSLPRLPAVLEGEFKHWLISLDSDIMRKLLIINGVEPTPSLARLELIKEALDFQPADMAVLSNWVL